MSILQKYVRNQVLRHVLEYFWGKNPGSHPRKHVFEISGRYQTEKIEWEKCLTEAVFMKGA